MKIRTAFFTVLLSLTTSTLTDKLPNAATYQSSIPYWGVNLAGGAFASGNAKQGTFFPVLNDASLFLYRSMNVLRIPVAWEYFADKNGNVISNSNDQAYLTQLTQAIEWLNS